MSKDRYKYFRLEAREIVASLTKNLLEVERGSAPVEVLAEVLRLAHTLKGAAGVVQLGAVAKSAHAIEDVMVPYRASGGAVEKESIDRALKHLDDIDKAISGVEAESQPGTQSAGEPPVAEQTLETLRVEIGEISNLVDGINEVAVHAHAIHQAASQLRELRKGVRELVDEVRKNTTAERRGSRLTRQAEELSATSAELDHRLAVGLHRMERQLEDVRHRAERLRLLPASSLFLEIERAARDAARSCGKKVTYQASGGEHRLDAHVLSALRVALLHLVRNAIVHGIEEQSIRSRLGKTTTGSVIIAVERRGHTISFRCSDDGRGVDVEAVRRAARDQNLISDQEDQRFTLDHALRLIFHAGLTTTKAPDMVSGRGMGLDIVRDTVAKLKGQVLAQSEPGRGMMIELVVPLSLTSMETLVLQEGRTVASLPFPAVRRVVRVSAPDIASSSAGESILYEGQAVPFTTLDALMGWTPRRNGKPRSFSTIIVQSGSRIAALGVEKVLGTRTEVIRPIPIVAGNHPLLLGASFDAEGNPHLVLDPSGLVAGAAENGRLFEEQLENKLPILVVDDSLTTRMLEQTILEANGYSVELATSAEEALRMIKKRRYGLMLVDVEMPGMNGFELLDLARSDPCSRDVPAILVTTRGSAEDRRRGMEVGARGYILKNEFEEGLLLQMIRGFIG